MGVHPALNMSSCTQKDLRSLKEAGKEEREGYKRARAGDRKVEVGRK